MRCWYSSAAVLFGIIVMICGFLVVSGCNKKPKSTEPPKAVVTSEEVRAPAAGSFQHAASVISGVARDPAAVLGIDSLSRLHVSGIALLAIALFARLFFGTWKDAYIAAGIGIIPATLATLLTEYSRVVLLVPLCGVVILGFAVYRRVMLWRTEALGFEVVATAIEQADTGRKTLGSLMKDRIAESGMGSAVDKALKPLEKIWKAAK